jgi:hypothetical protein
MDNDRIRGRRHRSHRSRSLPAARR